MYLIKLPRWIQGFYPNRLFQYDADEKVIYLTFDDGPNPATTPFILDSLAQHNAKGSFFCIGKNVALHDDLFRKIKQNGHLVANHTYHHLNGWEENEHTYLNDFAQADKLIESDFFRPPYGRMRKKQEHLLLQKRASLKVVMWSVLSGDFDTHITGEQCWHNVQKHTDAGDIIVFHDSDKARERLEYALPKTLEHFSPLGFRFDVLY
ncbi:MAG: polysaccharide deacetylase family protein [Chitinophagaceae bacterium]